MGVSKNRGTLKSSILIGFSLINHSFWGTNIFWKHPNRTLDEEVRQVDSDADLLVDTEASTSTPPTWLDCGPGVSEEIRVVQQLPQEGFGPQPLFDKWCLYRSFGGCLQK